MIRCEAVDVEIFPNMFSVSFVDLNDYLNKFKEISSKSALPDVLTVSEIKSRLQEVKSKIFYISDTDDSQLLDLAGYFSDMRAKFIVKTDDNGCAYQEPYRTDLYGFNNKGYDDLMIGAFLMNFDKHDSTKNLISYLYDISQRIIKLQNNDDVNYVDHEIELIRTFKLPYVTVDVQQVYGLHSAGVNVDKDTGKRTKYSKSLKQTSINLKWHELLDFTLPPIDEEEYNIYWSKHPAYKQMSIEELNKLSIGDFHRYVLPKYIEHMLYYNLNDVYLVCELVRQKPDEVKLRYAITQAFGINVMCSARANIADKLTTKFYSDRTGLKPYEFIKGRTERTALSFKKIIFPHIQFKTKQLQDFLEEIKTVTIYHTTKAEFERVVEFYGTTYTIAAGGIHSQDKPGVFKSTDSTQLRHHDYTSYYPSIMISYGLCPKHLHSKSFVGMLDYMKETRVKCKHTKDSDGYVIDGVPNKIGAEALKIVINSIYGKLGSELSFLYDRFVQMQVTINGQLMTMTLIEELELNDIHVISANTDGIIIKLPKDKIQLYEEITTRWNETNKMGADYEDYSILVCRDINNYLDLQTNGEVEFKGALDPKQYIKDVKKGYDMPIVAEAVYQFFVNNVPVIETLHNGKILDFCKTQNVGRQFEVCYDVIENGQLKTVYSQRHVRFYVCTKGVVIQKEDKVTKQRSRLASGKPVFILNSLDDKPIEERNIDYRYYYDEAYKIINPILLGISPNQKGDATHKTKSGKALIKQKAGEYLSLFNDDDYA